MNIQVHSLHRPKKESWIFEQPLSIQPLHPIQHENISTKLDISPRWQVAQIRGCTKPSGLPPHWRVHAWYNLDLYFRCANPRRRDLQTLYEESLLQRVRSPVSETPLPCHDISPVRILGRGRIQFGKVSLSFVVTFRKLNGVQPFTFYFHHRFSLPLQELNSAQL
jgi:hypothetical protein